MATTQQYYMQILCSVLLFFSFVLGSQAHHLSSNFYEKVCPQALPAIRSVVEHAIQREPRMGASLLRLHFHDCFVNGCDGSLLLDDTESFIGEKTAPINLNSARGFEVVDMIKSAVNDACYGNIVSCADILAVAARDSVVILGGPYYEVHLGRRDAQTSSKEAATDSLPSPFSDFSELKKNFRDQGLSVKDLVALSGAHTLGFSQCNRFRERIYNSTNIDRVFANERRWSCPSGDGDGDDNLSPLDESPTCFDTRYFGNLMERKGLLKTDQELFKGDGSQSDKYVRYYSGNSRGFRKDFARSMLKMGNIGPLTGNEGEIRMNCRRAN